jgi:hypothetical protein
MPQRQTILVAADYLHLFLIRLRVVEVIHGVQVMPGQPFTSMTGSQLNARWGFDGLQILIHVLPKCPNHRMRAWLAQFLRLHGPLNELRIVGYEDSK